MRAGSGRRQLALAVLLAAAGLALLAIPVRSTWWGGLVLAVAEAGIVGGLADWFAVTALFRRPLGLPIPHTALIPRNWELLAARVGTMVGQRVLTKAYVLQELARLDLADALARAAERLTRADLESLIRRLAGWAVAALVPETAGEAVARLARRLGREPAAPALARALEVARQHGWDERAIAALARGLVEALERPELRLAVGDLLDELLAHYRERMGVYPRLWLGLANLLGLVDRDRAVATLLAEAHRIAAEPDHPLRRRLAEMLAELPARLRADSRVAARVEAAKRELLATPVLARLAEDAVRALRALVAGDLASPEPELVAWITERLERARRTLSTDAALRRSLEAWIKARAAEAVERHHDRVATFIENGVRALGPQGAVRLIEEHAGDDLQYIRVNGTVVGGLAGGALYGVHMALRWLSG